MDTIYTDLEQIAQLLKTTFTGNNETVKTATEMLLKLSENPLSFSKALFNIIKVEKNDGKNFLVPSCKLYKALTENIKSSASLALSRCITDGLKKNKISQEERSYLINAVIECIFSEFVSMVTKVNLQLVLIMLYALEYGNIRNLYVISFQKIQKKLRKDFHLLLRN